MNTPAPTDEGEPLTGKLNFKHFFSFTLLILTIACNNLGTKNTAHFITKPHTPELKIPPAKAKPLLVKKKSAQKKKIYLTFDDGPNKGTKNVLDIVKEENIPATFFIVGEHVFASSSQAKVWDSLLATPSIEICNHSYTHAHNKYDHFYQTPATVVKDMEKTKEKLLPNTDIVRAPGRNSWRTDSIRFTDIKKSKAAMDSLQQAGFQVLGWDLEWHYDPKTFKVKNSAEELLAQVDSMFKKNKTKLPGNLVILAHDQVYHSTADSLQLRQFIQKLKANNEYELSLVSSYPAIKKKSVTDSLKTIKAISVDTLKKQKADSL